MSDRPGASIGSFGRTNLRQKLVSGGAVGNITVTGIKTADVIVGVILIGGTTTNHTDLTSEFTITATDTINNAAGTNTSNTKLLVTWHSAMPEP